jgi:hypothetical protein
MEKVGTVGKSGNVRTPMDTGGNLTFPWFCWGCLERVAEREGFETSNRALSLERFSNRLFRSDALFYRLFPRVQHGEN